MKEKKEIAYRFIVTCKDVMTAKDLGIFGTTKEEKKEKILETYLNDLKKGHITNGDFRTFTEIKEK